MHELSLARAIVAEVSQAASDRDIASVAVIEVKIGELCGVIADSLAFAFEFVAGGTALEGAVLEFSESPVTMWCESCEAVVQPEVRLVFSCPRCQAPCPGLRSGTEIEIVRFSSASREVAEAIN